MKKLSKVLIILGLVLILAAFLLTGYNFYDEHRAAIAAEEAMAQLKLAENVLLDEEIPDYILNPQMTMPVQKIDGVDYIGTLEIPALGLSLPIISEWSYPNLKLSPCRYHGSAYTDDLVLAGHNYPSHFGSLKNLYADDEIIFTDIDGNIFNYKVVEQEVLAATAIEEMNSGNWDLTLFTCTIGGKSRMAIRCEKI